LGVFIEQLREVNISFVVPFSPFVFLHDTTSTERICAKMNIGGFYKNFSILSKFSESRVKQQKRHKQTFVPLWLFLLLELPWVTWFPNSPTDFPFTMFNSITSLPLLLW
jgi:hypothetical protein